MITWRERGARVLREPLAHFLAAGALVFALFGGESTPDERRIVIDAPRIERLVGQFAQSFRRAPDDAELDALIRDDVREEIYYREALRLGLDRDDAVVRRRMRNKMEAFAVSAAELAAPDDATLQDWLDRHPARFAGEPRYSFDQRFIDSSDAGAAAALTLLDEGKHFAGAPIPLPAALEHTGPGEIASLFGEAFVAALARAPLGEWSGPVESGFGSHLIRVRARERAPPPTIATIRQRLENDWRAALARERTERAYRALLDGYTIEIEKPG